MKDQTAQMLGTLLACAERPDDMRLNQHLDESDIAETIRVAIECIENAPPPDLVKIPRAVAFGFAGSVEALLTESVMTWDQMPKATEYAAAIGYKR